MSNLSRGYQSPKVLIERLMASGFTKSDIADQVGLTPWAIGKIVKYDTDTASLHWFKLKKLATKIPKP